jgi:mRNA interferase MazF
MNYRCGEVVLAWYPFASGAGRSRRPVVIVQNDTDNGRMQNTIVAQVTSTLHRSSEPTQLLIEVSTPDGRQSGLLHDSVISCNNLATIDESLIQRSIGRLPLQIMVKLDHCLKAALALH